MVNQLERLIQACQDGVDLGRLHYKQRRLRHQRRMSWLWFVTMIFFELMYYSRLVYVGVSGISDFSWGLGLSCIIFLVTAYCLGERHEQIVKDLEETNRQIEEIENK